MSDGEVLLLLSVVVVAAVAAGVLPGRLRAARRASVRRRGLSADHRAALATRMPLYRFLSADQRERLHGLCAVFLAEKTFVAAQGAKLEESHKAVVAAHACLLLLGRGDDRVYPGLSTVVVHPAAWVRRDERWIDGGVSVVEEAVDFDGESWDAGVVVLSLRAVRDSVREFDGFNVVLHEFAHQIDADGKFPDGVPPMPPSRAARWRRIMGREWETLRRAEAKGRETLIDPYGAESPEEFFAVVVETFFELPADLKAEHPELYALLVEFFALDPAGWTEHPVPRPERP